MLADAPRVQLLAGHVKIAESTLHVPHPYEDGMAEAWIASLQTTREARRQFAYAVDLAAEGPLVGTCTLILNAERDEAELAYWLGYDFWGHGYMSEAAQVLVDSGFEQLGLARIYASHFASNPRSGAVMKRLGMHQCGYRPQHVVKWGVPVDLVDYELLRP